MLLHISHYDLHINNKMLMCEHKWLNLICKIILAALNMPVKIWSVKIMRPGGMSGGNEWRGWENGWGWMAYLCRVALAALPLKIKVVAYLGVENLYSIDAMCLYLSFLYENKDFAI